MWHLDRWFPRLAGVLLAVCVTVGSGVSARALLAPWLQHAVSGSAIEAALFRTMGLPGVQVLYPRPPVESVAELNKLVHDAPNEAELLSLRARQEESALDFAGAERDWKAYADRASDKGAAASDVAAFYGRRLAVRDQFATLLQVGGMPLDTPDRLTVPAAQRSWAAFEQALGVAENQGFDAASTEPLWGGWMAWYPQQRTVYARAFTWELNHQRMGEAQAVLGRYRAVFPADAVFPVKAEALLALGRGGADGQLRALAVYDKGFSPMWPRDLQSSYFDLLAATHTTRRFVVDAQDSLRKDPADLRAAGRLFAYYTHQSHPEAALAVLVAYRESKETQDPSGRNWTPEQLDMLEQLAASAQAYPEAARYAFALHHLPGSVADGRSAREAGLAAMVGLLLDAPEQPIALGAGNLSMYRDIGTLDSGPGFWNGVLSLWLNDGSLQDQYSQQDAKAQPYFHRAEAAALLKLLDTEAPDDAQRASFHAKLIEAYATYGEDAAVLGAGEAFLQSFPHAPDRVGVALAMADADARRKDSEAEFGVYDRLLQELGEQTGNLPLATAAMAGQSFPEPATITVYSDPAAVVGSGDGQDNASAQAMEPDSVRPEVNPNAHGAFNLDTGPPVSAPSPAAAAYAQVLDRTLGRLTAMHQLPRALAVLRKELDRNPNDPKLYERLATFLSQNNLSAGEEEVYRAAIARFGDRSWYDKLARVYLREKRDGDYAQLVRQVTGIFSGTELDAYFAEVRGGGPQLALELNVYAHKRFPHDLVFTQNLLAAYTTKSTRDDKAWEGLLRETWWQSPELTSEFFAYLSRTGKLKAELAALPADSAEPENPAVTRERAEAAVWDSHFETGAPLFDELARQYPADESIGTFAANLNRSVAWLDPAGPAPHIAQAVGIERRLLSANPGDLNRLARLGDIVADHADGTPASYRPAAVYWKRMPATAPGNAEAYLQAATVFWDYFQFDQALAEIRDARSHFSNPVLYGYEAGAILEGKRDLPGAVREYTAAALTGVAATGIAAQTDRQAVENRADNPVVSVDPETNPSAGRLLRLARRADTAALVDSVTGAEQIRNGSVAALQLRVAVLDAEHHGAEAAPLLLAAIRRAATVDAEADLATYAQARGDAAAREAALSRESELTPDPAERLRLRYELVQAYGSRGDLADAERLVDGTYRDNPLILGVVRSTVDFDWRNKRSSQAVDVLVEAAHAAQPPLAGQFAAEAAAKANESGDPARGRSLAFDLLIGDPYNAQYLSLAAESYARTGDHTGLESFYRARLDTVRSATMTPADRRTRTALLRKGLIPALTEARDYAGATDQYIALVTAYPEDGALVREAALYAAERNQKDKLLAFYRQTVGTSPRDARYLVDLAQTEVLLGDADAALDAYTRAVALRPERSDLLIAKAGLEERLGHYNEAVVDYGRLYQLSYKDPQWMVAAAKAQARQGRAGESVKSLEAAFLHGAQSTPHDNFLVAAQLEEWNLLSEAQRFAEAGAAAAGDDLLAGNAPRIGSDDPVVLARILTRRRGTGEAFKLLRSALDVAASSPSSPETVGAQVRAGGLASVTDAEWRRSYAEARKVRAAAQFNKALNAMGEAVAQYGTPEEHAAFVTELKAQRGAANRDEMFARWIPAAHAAGLGALEATWRAEMLTGSAQQGGTGLTAFARLEDARAAFAELGHTLESIVRLYPHSKLRSQAVHEAIEAFGAADDTPAQLRLLPIAWAGEDETAVPQQPYMSLLAHRDPNALVSLAANKRDALANAAVQAALDQPSPELALRAVNARGAVLGSLWTANYTALGGLYAHGEPVAVRAAFDGALGQQRTVAERLGSQTDATRELAGRPWFYLAGRYGEWLLANPSGATQAEDVVAADLEAGKTAGGYLALAQTEAEAGRRDAALQETAHALELAPTSATAYDMRAGLLWELNRKEEAVTVWTKALDALRSVEERGPAPESFWIGFSRIAGSVHQHGLFAQLKPAMDGTLRSYIARNGSYRSNELLEAAFGAAPNAEEGTAWVISLAGAGKDPAEVLSDLDYASWLPPSQRGAVLERELVLVRDSPSGATDTEGEPPRLAAVRAQLIRFYIRNHQGAQALALLETAPASGHTQAAWQEAEIVASAQTGALPALLQRFDAQPGIAPDANTATRAATTLRSVGDAASVRVVLEWSLVRAEKVHGATSSDYLAAAEARLLGGDPGGAVALLGALIAVSENPDQDRDAGAALLEKSGRAADAIPFLAPLARGVPWEPSYRVRLAEAQTAAHVGTAVGAAALVSVAADPAAPYDWRARAARDLGKGGAAASGLGSAELDLLAAGPLRPAAVRQPFFAEARGDAAATTTDRKQEATLLREALGIAPYAKEAQSLRERLFVAEQQAGEFAAARAVLQNIFTGENSFGGPFTPEAEDGSAAAESAPLPGALNGAAPERKSAFARAIAEVYAATGDRDLARVYLLAALQLAPLSDFAAAATKQELAGLERQQRLAAANAARLPQIAKQLDQPRIVRARLTEAPDAVAPWTEVNDE